LVLDASSSNKSIISSRSFGNLITELEDLEEAVSTFVARASIKLRSQDSCASSIHVYIHTNKHKQTDKQLHMGATKVLDVSSSNTSDLIRAAKELLRGIHKPGYKYKKAGIVLMGLVDKNKTQSSLFHSTSVRKDHILMEMIDEINKKMGRYTLKMAAQGVNKRATWHMQNNWRSNRYTTVWDELPKVV
jgi:DNA polymerase V